MTNLSKVSLAMLMVFTLTASTFAQTKKDETSEQRREQLRVAVQAICPVSGESLTDHAQPVKLTNPETNEVLYVCGEACLKSKPDAKHLEKIMSNFAKAQGHCLVMAENEISVESKHGIIDGHFIYVCCPPCVKKMIAKPAMFLSTLDDLYEAYLKK